MRWFPRCTVGDVRTLLGLALVAVLGPAHIGSGDSVQARNTESVISSVVPELPDGVTISVVGFDTFIRVSSDGHEVAVPGYTGEPYLKITADGEVLVNDASTTAALNGDRYGNVDLSGFTPSDTPMWRRIGTNGVAMWHDHRSHWMSPKPPAPIDANGKVQDFTIELVVDGVGTTVTGSLYLRDAAGLAWWFIGLVGLVLALATAIGRPRRIWIVVTAVSVLGATVGLLEWRGLPPGARITPVLAIFCGGAVVIALIGATAERLGNQLVMPVMNAGAGAALLTAVSLCSDQVRAAYVPGLHQPWIARAVIPLLLGVALVAVIDGVMSVMRPPVERPTSTSN